MAKLSNLNIGLVNLFAVLLPGAIATALLFNILDDHAYQPYLQLPKGETAWMMAYVVLSFVIGHILYVIGAILDRPFEWARKWRLEQNAKSAQENDHLHCLVQIYKSKLFRDDAEQAPTNVFQFSKALLVQESPNAFIEVNKLEAEAKFFRSFSILAITGIFYAWYKHYDVIGLLMTVISILCVLRFYERRMKSNTLAYLHVLTWLRLKEDRQL